MHAEQPELAEGRAEFGWQLANLVAIADVRREFGTGELADRVANSDLIGTEQRVDVEVIARVGRTRSGAHVMVLFS
jgi:hypothetical protein